MNFVGEGKRAAYLLDLGSVAAAVTGFDSGNIDMSYGTRGCDFGYCGRGTLDSACRDATFSYRTSRWTRSCTRGG